MKKIRQKNDEIVTHGRFRHFDLKLKSYPLLSSQKLWKDSRELIDWLNMTQFLTQPGLRTFQMDYSNKMIELKNFEVQLELDTSTEAPYWHLIVETTLLTTRRFLARKIFESLYPTYHFEGLDSVIEIKVIDSMAKLVKEEQYTISKSNLNWSPGNFDKKTLDCLELLKNEEVKGNIQRILDRDSILRNPGNDEKHSRN